MLMFTKKVKENVKKNRKGYTLTELIVVVAILGVLAAVATPMILSQIGNAKEKTDSANARAITNAYRLAVANDDIKSTETNVGSIQTAIEKTLKPIPKPQQTGYFVFNSATGEVTYSSTSGAINIATNP